MSILDKINSPKDLKELDFGQFDELASEIRENILKRANTLSGHLAPDLGIVETTIAMHYVFNSPKDKFIFDVSHQCYPHKMLTGRARGFFDPANNFDISGYSNQFESEHDHFIIGHTSTSISLATGYAKARDLKGENFNVVALIGDGSLSGGEALEGLNNAAVLDGNLIIIVNDNEMSIAQNQGGLYRNLEELRSTYGEAENNIFKNFGLEYHYVEKGNDVKSLIEVFSRVKDTKVPTIVHIHTLKGKGYKPAEEDKERFHWIAAGGLDGAPRFPDENYDNIAAQFLLKKKEHDPTIVAITPATPGISGFSPEFREKMGKNYTDVGIAEQHAIGYISGLATGGAKPVLSVASSFIQRAYDQLSQDLALNNAPATILITMSTICGADMTHLGIFDIPLIINIPNIVFLAPTNKEELLGMLEWSIEQKEHPVAIKIPSADVISTGIKDETNYSDLNKFKMVKSGEKVAIIGVGKFFELAKEVCTEAKAKLEIEPTLINPRFLSGLDEKMLEDLKINHKLIITLEDGCLAGGFGEKISAFYSNSQMKVLNYGAIKEFTDRVPQEELYRRFRLTKELICEDIKENI